MQLLKYRQKEETECTCGTDDDTHATDCPKYEAPENPVCTCVEKCTEDIVNVWCDVCGVQGAEACGSKSDEEAATFDEETGITYLDWDEDSQTLKSKTCASATVLTSDDTTWNSGWYVLNSDVTYSSRITVSGNVHLILADKCNLTAESGGINVSGGNSLTIYAQSTGTNMGILTAIATTGDYAGIGGGYYRAGGTISINGGCWSQARLAIFRPVELTNFRTYKNSQCTFSFRFTYYLMVIIHQLLLLQFHICFHDSCFL